MTSKKVSLSAAVHRLLIVVVALVLASMLVQRTQADALMRSQAITASTIAQYYVEETGVRVELEIGEASIEAFKNLLPDAIYQGLEFGEEPLEKRLPLFVGRELSILADGEALPGFMTRIGPSRRVLRDPINGTPLPIQDDAPHVVSATLMYPFAAGDLPQRLRLLSPRVTDIGFVLYHEGVAVNDYRYLASGYELTLDWGDPWYSSFNTRNLARQYSAPMSGFIYVENFEVRKEIIVRPKDLQRWVDLGLEGKDTIAVDMQLPIKQKIGAFLSQHQAVTIDGEALPGILDSVNFLERTLTSSRVIDPPQPLDVDAAVVGTIFVFPTTELPQSVVMDWDLWDERIQRIPVSAVDQAGPLPTFLEPDWRQLVWTNYLKNPEIPSLVPVESPSAAWRVLLAGILPLLLALALGTCLWLLIKVRRQGSLGAPASLAALLIVASVVADNQGESNKPQSERASAIVGSLLHNIYRAFDYRQEGDIYDVLAQSVVGDLLTDIYLETRRGLVLANQGGAQAKVKNVVLESVTVQPDPGEDSFTVEANWTVHGSVGHWGHIHQRSNRYLALLTLVVDEQQWKLANMSVLQEERL